jgi:cyclopropane-fatty-acyl-phospholipid synthase
VIQHWQVSGVHYQGRPRHGLRTWIGTEPDLTILERTYGRANARRWWVRWRVFFMACAELWGYRDGSEWGVSHYLLRKA